MSLCLVCRGLKHAQKLTPAAGFTALRVTVMCKELLKKGLWMLGERGYGN